MQLRTTDETKELLTGRLGVDEKSSHRTCDNVTVGLNSTVAHAAVRAAQYDSNALAVQFQVEHVRNEVSKLLLHNRLGEMLLDHPCQL